MACCRLYRFGNFRPRARSLPSAGHPPHSPWFTGGGGGHGGPSGSLPGSGLPFPPCFADAARGPRRLMRVGLALILVGHVNLLLGAVLHGTVLRHVANPRGAVTPEYTTANVISVGSGLLVSAAGGGAAGVGEGRRDVERRGLQSLCIPECFRGTCGPLGIQEPSVPTTGERGFLEL